MVRIESLAYAALNRENLHLRSLTQDLLRENILMKDIAPPGKDDPRLLAMAASLVELFALRLEQEPPAWTRDVGPLPAPFFLLESASTLRRLRELCQTQSPEPLRKRGFYAPPNFLEFA